MTHANESPDLAPGIYEHYKHKHRYQVLGIAIHTETMEKMVVYKALYETKDYGLNQLWIRPLKMFCEMVTHNGETLKRFRFISSPIE